jgi:carbon monoxide dehydrogenase subunit G
MEHEVFIPVSAETLRQTLRDPQRVARCVPGLQQDADAGASPLSGRLKVRIGGHTITYRGTLTLVERKGVFTAEGEGTEARGTGMAGLTLTLRLKKTRGGTTLVFTGGSRAEGRLTEVAEDVTTAAAHRLLDRFATRLKEESSAQQVADAPDAPDASDEPVPPDDADAAAAPLPARPSSTAPDAEAAAPDAADADIADADGPDADDGVDTGADTTGTDTTDPGTADTEPDTAEAEADAEESASVSDVAVPPPSLRGETTSGEGEFLVPEDPAEPPAEAAHARRTMIGRSAEEVDHAPPRGRYAPVPAPETAGAGATLRWVAPAAALALASAVVVGRALRRRK